MKELLDKISKCTICKGKLPNEPKPVLAAHKSSKIVIIGQAPGRKVQESGIPWDDKSGDNLRSWLGVDTKIFYDPTKIALIPMGFCYPGTGKSGDLPPSKECAPEWHTQLWDEMTEVKLIILVGNYAQKYYLDIPKSTTLTATVKSYQEFLPKFFVLPHPSPRNNIWQAKNEWFKMDVLPELERRVLGILFDEN